MGLSVGNEDELAAGAEAEGRVGSRGEEGLRFRILAQLPKHDRPAANGAAVAHLRSAERVGLPGEVDRHPHPAAAGPLEAVAADPQADARGERRGRIGIKVENLESHAALVEENSGVAWRNPPGEERSADRPRAPVLVPIERPRSERHRIERRGFPPTCRALEEGEVERVLVGPAPLLPFQERELSVDASPLGEKAAGEEGEEADVGDHEPRLVAFPGIPDRRRAENAHRQEGIQKREPPRIPDAELHRLGAIGTLDEGSQAENDPQQGDENHRELQRREKFVDGEHRPHEGGLIGRDKPACSHGMELRNSRGWQPPSIIVPRLLLRRSPDSGAPVGPGSVNASRKPRPAN